MWKIIMEDGSQYEFETKKECFDFYWDLPDYCGKVEIYQPNGNKY
jgi:hypothetical protein